jgi:hypothetical protein
MDEDWVSYNRLCEKLSGGCDCLKKLVSTFVRGFLCFSSATTYTLFGKHFMMCVCVWKFN